MEYGVEPSKNYDIRSTDEGRAMPVKYCTRIVTLISSLESLH